MHPMIYVYARILCYIHMMSCVQWPDSIQGLKCAVCCTSNSDYTFFATEVYKLWDLHINDTRNKVKHVKEKN